MKQQVSIGGTAYEISGGKTLVNGTSYSIKNGKTLVGGTVYEVGLLPTIIISGNGGWLTKSRAVVTVGDTQYGNEMFNSDAKLSLPKGTSIVCEVRATTNTTATITRNGVVVALVEGPENALLPDLSNSVTYEYIVSSSADIVIGTGSVTSGSTTLTYGTITITEH